MRPISDITARPQAAARPPASFRQQLAPSAPRRYAKPVVKAKRQLPLWAHMVLITIGALAIGSFAGSSVFGQLAVVGYGIVAIIFRVASRTTFLLVVLSLAATTWMLVMQGKVSLAQNFATYTFLLLVVGVITLSRELRQEGGRIYSSRKNTYR